MSSRSDFEIGEGIFDMPFISSLQSMSLSEAKDAMRKVVENSTARESNKNKALMFINQCKSVNGLMVAASNFSLSFQGHKVC